MINKTLLILRDTSKKRILGLPLLLRTILACHQAGIKKFLIIGHGGKEEAALIETIKRDRRVLSSALEISYLTIDNIFSNKTSLINHTFSSESYFLLIEGDLIFDPQILEQIKTIKTTKDEIIIIKKEKESMQSDSLWSGLALLPEELFSNYLELLATDNQKEQDALNTLGAKFNIKIKAFSTTRFLIRIDSEAKEKTALKALLTTARKPQDGFIARTINRPISLFFSRQLIKLGLTPGTLSLLNFLLGLSAAFLAGRGGGYWNFFLAGLLFELASIFDGCDGEVARLTYNTSEKGAASDVFFDALTYILFFGGLAIGLYRSRQNYIYLYLLGIFLLSLAWYYYNLFRYTKASGIGNKIFLVAKEIESKPKKEKKTGFLDRVMAKLAFAVRRDFFATFVFILLALGVAPAVIFIIVISSLTESTYFHFYVKKSLRSPNKIK